MFKSRCELHNVVSMILRKKGIMAEHSQVQYLESDSQEANLELTTWINAFNYLGLKEPSPQITLYHLIKLFQYNFITYLAEVRMSLSGS